MIETIDITSLLQENDLLKKQVAYYQETNEQLERERAYLQEKIAACLEEVEVLERECAHQRNKIERDDTEHTWRKQVDRLPGYILSPSEKLTTNALRSYFQRHPTLKNTDGYWKLETWQLAQHDEQGDGALRANINTISIVHENDKPDRLGRIILCDKKIVHIPDPNIKYKYTEETYIKPLDLFYEPLHWEEACTQERNQGGPDRGQGRKKKCPCGGLIVEKDITTKKQLIEECTKCGKRHIHEERIINPPKIPMNDFPPDNGGGNQVDFGDPVAGNQVDFDGCNQLDTVKPTLEHNQVDFPPPEQDDPVTPPPYAIGEYPTNGFSWVDHLTRRIGHGRVIYSTGILDQSKKYLHKPEGYIPDIAAYLRGDLTHIYGSRPALPDGTTYLLGFDSEKPELDAQRLMWQQQLAAAGIPSVCWLRRPGRWHLEVYVEKAVDRKAFYAHLLSVCPGLAAIPEVFPIGSDQNTDGDDRADFPYSWPLYYRVGNQVMECAAEVMFAGDTVPMISTGIQSDKNRLTWLISRAILDASLIPAMPEPEEVVQDVPGIGGALLDIRRIDRPDCPFDDGLGKVVIAAFNAQPWEKIVEVVDGWFRATWRPGADGRMGERTPSVKINADGTAHDFGKCGRFPNHFDKFDVYCLVNQLDKGEELKRRIANYRRQEPIAS